LQERAEHWLVGLTETSASTLTVFAASREVSNCEPRAKQLSASARRTTSAKGHLGLTHPRLALQRSRSASGALVDGLTTRYKWD
jgi:hypothetical protein